MKYSLFFGAGAEMCFDLPSGDKFTKDSVLGKDNEFTNALAQKYSQENEITSKKIKYKSESFFYARNSLSFRNCIFKTAKQLFQDYKEANDQDAINFFKQFLLADKNSSESDDEIADRTDNLSKDSIENIKKYYDAIIKGEDDLLKFEEKYSDEIKKNLIINGEIEKDFYSLIEYDENTSQKYFRLFNFFWSSYFSIVMPLVEKKIEKSYKGNKYKYILDNLYTITDEIYSKEFLDNFLKEKNDENYYEKFNDFKDKITCVLTTNYTPFVRHCFKKICGDEIYYLSGELNIFERSFKNEIFMMHDKNKKENSCGKYKYLSTCEQPDEFDYFPFIMTQAPVKPLIHPFQFKIYADAYEKLKRSNCLIIIGYSLPNSDNHILTMIKTFLKQRGRKLIYFDYQKDLTNEPLDEKLKKKILVEYDKRKRKLLNVNNKSIEYDKRKRKLLNDSLNKNLIDFEKEIILATETNIKSKIYEHFNNKDQQLIYIVYSDKCQIKFNNILDIIKNINLKDLKNKKELMITK